jgi:hypothetical protein
LRSLGAGGAAEAEVPRNGRQSRDVGGRRNRWTHVPSCRAFCPPLSLGADTLVFFHPSAHTRVAMLIAQLWPTVIVVVVIFAVVLIVALAMFASVFTPWFQAYLAGIPISIVEILGMRLRRVNVKLLIRCLILAKMSGIRIPVAEMEKAYLQGVSIERITLAMIQAKKQRKRVTFQQLVELDREDRLVEKLKE